MRLPGRLHQGTQNDDLIADVDVAATFLDAAGIDIPDYMDGMSLLSLIDRSTADWRETFLYSYFFEPP